MDAIACVDSTWGIGYKGKLLYHIKDDMEFFKRMTYGKNIIMGNNTLNSFPNGKPLEGRLNVVLTHSVKVITMDETYDNLIYVPDTESVLDYIKDAEAFCIGGATVYEQLLPYCNKAYITWVEDTKKADTRFPNLIENKSWRLQYISEPLVGEYRYFSKVYENMNVKEYK